MARKKGSVRRSGRVVKGDVAPPNAIRRGEIVEEVVDNLRPWKGHKSRDAVTTVVEAVSGQQNADLKRACDDILREKKLS